MPPESVDELDLELLNALQITPRAPWSRLGRALGVDPATAARRWERLRTHGLAWTTCALGPAYHHAFCLAYVRLRPLPGALDTLLAHLTARPEVLYLHQLTGRWPLLAVVAARSPEDLAAVLATAVEHAPGLARHRADLRTAGHGEPTRWRLRALGPAQRQALQPPAGPAADPAPPRPHPLDEPLYALLREDGRTPLAELAARTGASEPTVRRRLGLLTATDALRVRCEVAQSVTGWPVTAVLRCSVPAAELDRTARALAVLPDVRLSCALTGRANLLLMLWLRSLDQLPSQEAILASRHPEVRIEEREVCLRTVKQLGRLLGPGGRAVGHADAGPAVP
ncbi:AsnC family transcriptional regulator [Kitasatospora phosalacinea]|uniref:AsnC family transcriptional regulator n=1 Tax=Kitasatospora phosalacinea TaxID=2065 RepID=A0A9W6V5S5_9ACTN|nr:Lrp/AsnC family transcriptional regulator [Kitasatospora phosalacinea]GLW73430.1 AsnC family transcriptional regulator [Kitasatospora phosalacinea]